MYTEALYTEVIEKYSPQATHLNIITGYSSGKFLQQIINQYPELCIKLYIGMTHQGIPKVDHDKYVQLMTLHQNIEVHYQIEGSPTHMKVYHFINESDEIKLIGSANFSENGFYHHREILTESQENLTTLFEAQALLSARCDSDIVKDKINFIESMEDIAQMNYEELYVQTPVKRKVQEEQETYLSDESKMDLLYKIRNKHFINPTVVREVDLVLEEEADPNWQTTRLNAAFNHMEAYISTYRRPYLNDFFPMDKSFNIKMEDGSIYKAELFGPFKRKLRLLNGDWYLLIREQLDMTDFQPISRFMLKDKGMESVIFERIEETLFNMYFSSNEQ